MALMIRQNIIIVNPSVSIPSYFQMSITLGSLLAVVYSSLETNEILSKPAEAGRNRKSDGNRSI
jgi:hypothetical protein